MCARVLILLSVLSGLSSGPVPIRSAPTSSSDWQIRYSTCMPSAPTPLVGMTGWFFDFPPNATGHHNFPCSVNYVTTPYTAPLTGSLTMTAQVVATSGTPVFNFDLYGDNNGPEPANARLYFERAVLTKHGDISGEPDWYRWWYDASTFYLDSAGSVTIVAPLDPAVWSDANGIIASNDLVDWEAALAAPGAVGMTFGGGWFFGHGVNVSGGTARFILTGYSVQ